MFVHDELIDVYKKARNGDLKAEEQLFEQLRVRFEIIAKHRLKEDYSEDIAHDACLTVLEKFKELSSDIHFEPWAYKVLRNKIGTYMRDSKLRNSKLVYTDKIESLISNKSIQNKLDLKLKISSCLKKLAETNPKYLKIIDLKNQGYSTEEICVMLKTSSNNFYVMLHRCRSLLYNCIYNSEDE